MVLPTPTQANNTDQARATTRLAGKGPKAERTRAGILAAAAQVVGHHGYPNASIARITEAANISSGSFYYYYQSRDQVFDELLPALGKEMVAFIVQRVAHLPWGLDREMAAFAAYFDYVEQAPHFVRIFTEAQVYVPAAYETHFRWIVQNYLVGLRRQVQYGHLKVAKPDLLSLAHTLMGIRNYATQMLYGPGVSRRGGKASMMRIYRQVVSGLFVS